VKDRCRLLLAALVLVGCAKPFAAPAVKLGTIAVLPPSNLTGDPLLVAGGSFLESYVFQADRVTVPDLLLAESRGLLLQRGYQVAAGARVGAATEGRAPASAAEAAALLSRERLAETALWLQLRQWEPDEGLETDFVIVALRATLVDVATGRVLWEADRPPKPVRTPGSISRGTAYAVAAKKVIEEILASWQPAG
jgi:hypothetical protein